MEFNSYIFTLCFLPCVIVLYYLLQRTRKTILPKILLLICSLYFIAFAGVKNLAFLLISIGVNYVLALLLLKNQSKESLKKILVTIGVLFHLGILGYTKYIFFVSVNLERYLKKSWEIEDIFIPLGISFVTFQQIAYLVDVYRGKVEKLNFLDYALYVAYFPKYIQGPIAKYSIFVKDLNSEENKKINTDNLAYGIWLFVTGLAKKVLLADVFSKAVSWGLGGSIDHLTSMDAILVVLSFTFQIYFDFSGYSSMAMGISKMLNIQLPDNFDSPYQSLSVVEFWKRWHISLTGFLREYLYFPLGGSKKGKIRSYVNMFLVFFISGIWHGAAWTYIVWGAMQGVAYCLNKAFYNQWKKLNQILQWMFTFLFVNISWLFFRASSVGQAVEVLKKIVRMENTGISDDLLECFRIGEISFIANRIEWIKQYIAEHRGIEMSLFMVFAFVLSLSVKDRCAEKFKPTAAKCVVTMILFSWSVISFATVVEYIYGGF